MQNRHRKCVTRTRRAKFSWPLCAFAREACADSHRRNPFWLDGRRKMMIVSETTPMPGEALKAEKMPGHWLLARLGKRVLRPGGRQLTHRMIEVLNVRTSDQVIEFAPGLGDTTRLILKRKPACYTAVERDKDAAALVQKLLQG